MSLGPSSLGAPSGKRAAPRPQRHASRAVTPRSDESVARESRRARSSTSLSGVKGEAVTGRPALFTLAPAYELERMPTGGGYPKGFVALAASLMGCTDLASIVHVCSGGIRAPRTIDIRPESCASVVADARWLPLRRESVRWVMCDPPYSPEHDEALWGGKNTYPTPAVLLREIADALCEGGRVAFLHFVVPRLPDSMKRVGTFGVTTGPGYRIRCLTLAEKRAPARTLFS